MSDKELEGKMDKAKGNIKETVGKMTDDKSMEAEGKADQMKGEAKETAGEAKRKAKNALDGDK